MGNIDVTGTQQTPMSHRINEMGEGMKDSSMGSPGGVAGERKQAVQRASTFSLMGAAPPKVKGSSNALHVPHSKVSSGGVGYGPPVAKDSTKSITSI